MFFQYNYMREEVFDLVPDGGGSLQMRWSGKNIEQSTYPPQNCA